MLSTNTNAQVRVNNTGSTLLGSLKPQLGGIDAGKLWVNGRGLDDWNRAAFTTLYTYYGCTWHVRRRLFPFTNPLPTIYAPKDVFYVRADGLIYAERGIYNGSDSSLKTNITDLTDALSLIEQLHPVTYQFKLDLDTLIFDSVDLENTNPRIGFMAHEIETVLPGLISKNRNPDNPSEYTLAVCYTDVIPVLTKGIQEQQEIIKDLEGEIEALTTTVIALSTQLTNLNIQVTALSIDLAVCCSGQTLGGGGGQGQNTGFIEPTPPNYKNASAWLLQNIPNPFNQKTKITFYLPNNYKNAQIYIHDLSGIELKKYDLTGNGEKILEIEGGTLSNGMYNYTLVVDGQIIDTKNMILTK